MADKQICWIGSSKEDLSSFSQEAKREAGFQLRAIKRGQKPTDFKPMPTIDKGTEESRI